ncbi:uncharacterized protein BX664DRAFT_320340 [Halteromyces radiatus]|uniref:uncharacterized protein n=1 Tax=Halteromyces radiatus TaxID=101107 RepID=UPI00221FAD20|nr:uncharacterized protein BX664DRAFT_320340 [Halteromyces radiatus]KAI8099077.1 hypothetical protein BX664DRAFT_320340 [Halteromyces radiatus]
MVSRTFLFLSVVYVTLVSGIPVSKGTEDHSSTLSRRSIGTHLSTRQTPGAINLCNSLDAIPVSGDIMKGLLDCPGANDKNKIDPEVLGTSSPQGQTTAESQTQVSAPAPAEAGPVGQTDGTAAANGATGP